MRGSGRSARLGERGPRAAATVARMAAAVCACESATGLQHSLHHQDPLSPGGGSLLEELCARCRTQASGKALPAWSLSGLGKRRRPIAPEEQRRGDHGHGGESHCEA
mmetsp:Transcript_58814/g.110210  ORF Transcript_58814/g.110210 Transcript_58814/m.110210 type:complete len:107 (-) Transcript_58814:474-794(-)